MTFAIRLSALALSLACLVGPPARAEEWGLTGATPSEVYETDFSTLDVKEEVVRSWTRETLSRPARDAANGKRFTVAITRRSDDCQRRKFALGDFIRRDEHGVVVSQGKGGSGWMEVVPGSVSESIWRTVCAATKPPMEDPWLASITDGTWRSLGLSADRKFTLSARMDRIAKLPSGLVLSVVRSDYAKPEWIDGYPVRHIVTASAIDCTNEKTASAGIDLYVASSLRVKAVRLDPKPADFAPVAPGSFLSANLREICASAVTVKDPDSEDGGNVFTGTAWGVSKGYLITASHVIQDGKKIVVYRGGEPIGDAKVVLNDQANDLAVLKFSRAHAAKLKVLPLAEHGAALGRSVFTLGFPVPGVLGQRIKMTAGQVSSTAGLQDDARFLQISVPIQQGNSGGPIIGWDGVVVGVVSSKLTRFGDDDEEQPIKPENVNYAVKSSYLRPMLDDLPDLGNYEVVKAVAGQEQFVADASAAVFMLVVTK